MIEFMATAHGLVGSKQWLAREREIADRVKDLVTHELVGKAQTFRIEHAIFADDKRILE